MKQRLKELTDLTIKEILNLDIVLPEIYQDIFYTKAQELGISLDDIDQESALLYALDKIHTVRAATEHSASALKENVVNARKALSNKDERALEHIENNITELEKKIVLLQQELYVDELTRLYNRRWLFETYLTQNLFTASGTIAFIDINGFKGVNDRYGHLIGDKVLHVLGKVFKKVKNCTAVRFAGDEFLLLSDQHGEEEMTQLLSTINHNLRKTPFKHEHIHFYVDFSFGIAPFQKNDTFKTTLDKADVRMYDYKKSLK
jgi:diguanylate cyclase (GGDEF)-like protein